MNPEKIRQLRHQVRDDISGVVDGLEGVLYSLDEKKLCEELLTESVKRCRDIMKNIDAFCKEMDVVYEESR